MRLFIMILTVFIVFTACKNDDKKAAATDKMAALTRATADSSKYTTLEWLDSADKNFGRIAEGKKLEVAFRFRNTGDQPLVIEKVQPSCGCTVAEQPEEPISPGKEGVIKASFNSEGRIGPNHKTLYVYANTRGNRSHELHFEVEVEKKKW